MGRHEETVAVGDIVACDGRSRMRGVVIERVCDEDVLVLWDDLSDPLTQRYTSLKWIASRKHRRS